MIVICSLCLPADAAVTGAYKSGDYISSQSVDGDNLFVTFKFDDTPILFSEIVNDLSVNDNLFQFNPNSSVEYIGRGFTTTEYTSKWLLRMYLGGKKSWAEYPAPDNGVFYVGDIMPGATINVSCGFKFESSCESKQSYPFNDITYVTRVGMFYYDADGDYLGRHLITEETAVHSEAMGIQHEHDVDVNHEFTLESNVSYILPFYDVDVVLNGEQYCKWNFYAFAYPFTMSTSVSMIYKESLTMEAIRDDLGDISDTMDEILGVLDKDMEVDVGSSDFSSVGDGMSSAVDAVSGVMSAGSSSVSDLADSSVMGGTLTALASGLSVAFSDDFQITLCGLTFNPFEKWVTVIGGFSLIALMVAYIFRKRGGGDS